MTTSRCSALISLALLAAPALAQEQPDTTLSPYFFVRSDSPEVDQLPLQRTGAKVDIVGVIADVRVTQVYKNEGRRPIEATYVFPASTRAAVYAMKMTIGERTIEAKIREREQARLDYESAKRAGRSASLLEQERPNVFQMSVANIMPGDEIEVEMSYTELLEPTDGAYSFVYPTVVGPRYSNKTVAEAQPKDKWIATPYTKAGEPPLAPFDLDLRIAAGMPIAKVTCESHKTTLERESDSVAHVKLDDRFGGNRDFILKYELRGGGVQSGLLLHQGEKENFFLLMMQPPQRVTPDAIPQREFIFIMDVSGSATSTSSPTRTAGAR